MVDDDIIWTKTKTISPHWAKQREIDLKQRSDVTKPGSESETSCRFILMSMWKKSISDYDISIAFWAPFPHLCSEYLNIPSSQLTDRPLSVSVLKQRYVKQVELGSSAQSNHYPTPSIQQLYHSIFLYLPCYLGEYKGRSFWACSKKWKGSQYKWAG